MNVIFRVAALILIVPATYYFVYWVPLSFVPVGEGSVLPGPLSLACAVAAGWYVWNRLGSADAGLVSSVLTGAALLGGIGFCAGFFGPLVFAPEANQGPLLGLLITGPLGFLLGGVAGGVRWWVRRRSPGAE